MEYIGKSMSVQYQDEAHILLSGCQSLPCTCPRIHVRNTSEIQYFQIVKDIRYDTISKKYALVGLVGCKRPIDLTDLNKLTL